MYDYLIQEVQKPYRQQGVDINDKHIEVICRQMMRKVRVEDAGDSDLLSGSTVDIIEFKDAYKAVQTASPPARPTTAWSCACPPAPVLLMGITKASLATESSCRRLLPGDHQGPDRGRHQGQGGPPAGPEENVIIGKLIPAGSGLAAYRKYDKQEEAQAESASAVHATQELMRSSY